MCDLELLLIFRQFHLKIILADRQSLQLSRVAWVPAGAYLRLPPTWVPRAADPRAG